MTMLVFGKSGQVARELARLCPDAILLGRDDVDLADSAAVTDAIARHRPTAVINAAAYTNVDGAEAASAEAMAVNARAPGAMARACAALGIPFVHFSTDYVFDGSGNRARTPGARMAPLNVYGLSKLAGEEAIRAAGGRHVILRTSWVFSAHGKNFVKTILRLGTERPELRIVADQIGAPTPASALADAALRIAAHLHQRPQDAGTYHLAGAGDVSWAEFARAILAEAGADCAVTDIPTAEYPTPALRPLNSRLDCRRTTAVFGIARPDWREALTRTLAELGSAPRNAGGQAAA